MPASPRVATLIPAPEFTQGLPDGCLERLGCESLLSWAIAMGRQVPDSMGTFVFTAGDAIAEEARRKGATVLDHAVNTSHDDSPIIDIVDRCLDVWEAADVFPDIIVLLKPTAPFRSGNDIRQCLARLEADGMDSVATFRPLSFHPSWLLTVGEHGRAEPMETEKVAWNGAVDGHSIFALSGEIHVFDTHAYRRRRPPGVYFGNAGHVIRDGYSMDIKSPFDLATARKLLVDRPDTLGLDPVLLDFVSRE